ANVDKEMATVIAENIGVNPPSKGNVPVTKSSPTLSLANQPHYAYTQKVGILIGNGFKGEEVKSVINTLKEYGVFMDVISEKLGSVTEDDDKEIKVDMGYVSTYAVLYDSLYVVGGRGDAYAKLHQDIMHFVNSAYKHYKPIGVATTGENYIQISEKNN